MDKQTLVNTFRLSDLVWESEEGRGRPVAGSGCRRAKTVWPTRKRWEVTAGTEARMSKISCYVKRLPDTTHRGH